MKIGLVYLYRDGANYKRKAQSVFANPNRLTVEAVESRFLEAAKRWQLLPDIIHFKPEIVGLPTCYFTDIGYSANSDDFELHELDRIVETEADCTDSRTVEEFLRHLSTACHRDSRSAVGF